MADPAKEDPPKPDPAKGDEADDAATKETLKGLIKEAVSEWVAEREKNAPPPEPPRGLAKLLNLK